MSPKVNYEPSVVMICRCRFLLGQECASLAGDVDNAGSCAREGTGVLGELSVPSSQLCSKPKNALNK